MNDLPDTVMARIDESHRPTVRAWWAGLAECDRRHALAAWDEARQAAFFAPETADEAGVPVVIGGRFVPAEQPLVGAEWRTDYFEYLLKYPELLLNEIPYVRIGGICTAHPAARAAAAVGHVPADFACPVGSAECPMRQLLAHNLGRALQLTGLVARR